LYGQILKTKNILSTFDDFIGKEILSDRDTQDYHSIYIDFYDEFRKIKNNDKENINDDLIFEMELIKQVEINIDYILELIRKYHRDHILNCEISIKIRNVIDSSVELRNKKDLIDQFINSLNIESLIDEDWQEFVEKKKIEELDQIIKDEDLNRDDTYEFVKNSFRDGNVSTTGTALSIILPPISRFSKTGELTKKKESVIEKLIKFFNRFFNISNKEF
jgi:type I restriction enzyme R subunit